MSDYDDDDLDQSADETPEPSNTPKKNWRRELEAQAEEGRRAAAEAAQAKRELAFLKAGIDLDTPQGRLLAKAYDGDPTAEAVKAYAEEYGVLQPAAPVVPVEELQAHERVAAASAGAVTQSQADLHMSSVQNAQSISELMQALAAADPALVDTQSKPVPGTWTVGDGNTPVTTPS